MSRKKNFLRGVISGYLAMGANIVYTMGSIPLALHYLSKDEFGLWALVSQLAGYLMLIDLGMSGSSARLLIDCKDDRDGGKYGSMLMTAILVFSVQAAIVAIGGCLIGPVVSHLVDVPKQHVSLFGVLFAFQCILLALGYTGRFLGAPLTAHQRYDVFNFGQASQLLVAFVALWVGLVCHLGIYSMILSGLASWAWSNLFLGLASYRLGLFPKRGCWGHPNRAAFREMFSFGKDVFIAGLGAQLLSASQVIIVSRVLGLESAATWAICTKMATLAQQFVWRIFDYCYGAFSEMFVRGELRLLKKRFVEILVITGSLSVFICALLAFCNTSFVYLWTHGRVSWNPVNDLLLGLLLICSSVIRCHNGMNGVTKQIGFARYLYFLEGIFFVITAFFAAKFWGFSGVIGCAILAELLFPCAYGLYRSKLLFGASYREMTAGWLSAPLRYGLVFLVPAFFMIRLLEVFGGQYALFIRGGFLMLSGGALFWWVGLTAEIREELALKIKSLFNKSRGSTAEPEKQLL